MAADALFERALAAVTAMDTPTRKRFFSALESHPLLFLDAEYFVVPAGVMNELTKAIGASIHREKQLLGALAQLGNQLAGRNRKSSPETIRRNVQICDLRQSNPRLWTQGRLAKDVGVDRRTIRRILLEEDKWRRLAATLKGAD